MGSVFVSEDGLQSASYDTSLIAAQGPILAGIAELGLDTEAMRIAAAYSGAGTNGANGANGTSGAWQGWGGAFGGELELDGSARDALDASSRYGGLVGGFAGSFDGSLDGALGFSLGFVPGETTIDSRWMESHASEHNTYLAGASLLTGFGSLRTSLGLRVGFSNFENDRHVNANLEKGGIVTATGDQDAIWARLSAGLDYDIMYSETLKFMPFARVSHLATYFDGYSESGADMSARATVDEYETSVTRGEIGVVSSQTVGAGTLHASVSLFGSTEGGDDKVNISMFDDTLTHSLTQTESFGWKAGIGIEQAVADSVRLTAGLDYMATDEGDSAYSADLAVVVRF